MNRFKSYCLVAAALAFSAQAAAQISWQPNFNLAPDLLQQYTIYPIIEADEEQGPEQNADQASELIYVVSKARRKQNLDNFIRKTRAVDPVGAQTMEKVFAETDVIEAIGQGIKPYGLSVNNTADAYTFYWITAWQAAHGDESEPTPAQVAGAKAQAAKSLLATPDLMAANDAGKQELSEAYLLQAVMISQYMDYAKTNRQMMPQIAAAVRRGAKAAGLDLDSMVLTESGFEPL